LEGFSKYCNFNVLTLCLMWHSSCKILKLVCSYYSDNKLSLLIQEGGYMETYGIISLLPVAVVIIVALLTKRTVEPLILGAVVGYVLVYKAHFFTEILNGFTTVVADNAWYILVFGMFGIVAKLLEESGSALGFAELGAKVARTKGLTILVTWLMGIAVFIDDYLNNLGVGTAMRNISDKNKIPREQLAYTINSTGAAVCVLIPMSSWGIFMISQMEELGVVQNGSGLSAYIHAIPFMFYPLAAVILVPLIGFGVIPLWGPMKKAAQRAEAGDPYSPFYHESHEELEGYSIKPSSPWFFIVPLGAAIVVTLVVNDILIGMTIGALVCLAMYLPAKIMTPGKFFDTCWSGWESMVVVTAIVISAFVLQEANTQLGLTEFVIGVFEPILSAKILPMAAFMICAFIAMCTGSFWGTAAIAFPILVPLGNAIGADPILISAAIISAGAFGSHACFYGDAATLACAATGCSNAEYAKTALPIIVLPTVVAIIAFLVCGIVMC